VAEALRKEPGLEVELVDGNRGELTVLVGGHKVAGKQGDHFPAIEDVVEAVRKAERSAAGAGT
jgi:hypothetical protein